MPASPRLLALLTLAALLTGAGCPSESGPTSAPPGTHVPAPPSAPDARDNYTTGDSLQINWHGSWYAGHVVEVADGRYKVHYDGWADSWDEWVALDRLRSADAGPVTGSRPS
ncbi:MAG TPA: hypothetical protein VGB53_15410 [Rubricoccaceae bacterium]